MTKKAEKMVSTYTDKLELHTDFFIRRSKKYKEVGTLDKEYESAKEFLKDIQKYFVDMIRGMYRFNMISEKDFDELHGKAHDLYKEKIDKIIDAYIEAKY